MKNLVDKQILWLKVKMLLLSILSIWGLFISDSLDSLIIKNSRNDTGPDHLNFCNYLLAQTDKCS